MPLHRLVAACLALSLAPACASPAEDEQDVGTTEGELQSAALGTSEMKRYARPAGLPPAWDQPDSTGSFDERGKCGPTAVANLLRLYGTETSPEEADREGVHWWIGTRGRSIRDWLGDKHPELGCTLEHPSDGPAFLRENLANGRPVLVWFNTQGGLSSHWVTAVGVVGSGKDERVVVMSWGRYYAIAMDNLDAAWRNVYWIRRPSIVCDAKTTLMALR